MVRAPYPSRSDNVHKNRTSFANAVGKDFNINDWTGIEVYQAPVARYEENNFIVNKYGKSITNARGKVGLKFADKILEGHTPEEGQEVVVTLFEAGSAPKLSDSYRAVLELERSPYPEELDHDLSYPILIEEAPDGMDYGFCDFVVNHYGGDHIVADFDSFNSRNSAFEGVVDLEDMT